VFDFAETIGTDSTHSLICRRIFASQASPPVSKPPSTSNHTSTPAARSASAMRRTAAASCDA
jgi:hypothetical protein